MNWHFDCLWHLKCHHSYLQRLHLNWHFEGFDQFWKWQFQLFHCLHLNWQFNCFHLLLYTWQFNFISFFKREFNCSVITLQLLLILTLQLTLQTLSVLQLLKCLSFNSNSHTLQARISICKHYLKNVSSVFSGSDHPFLQKILHFLVLEDNNLTEMINTTDIFWYTFSIYY